MNVYKKYSIDEKLKAIERFHRGEPKTVIGRSLGVPESTIRGWIKLEDKIKGEKRGQKRSHPSSSTSHETDDEDVLVNSNTEMKSLEHFRFMKDYTFELSKYFLFATEYFTNAYENLSEDFKNLINTIPLEHRENLMIKSELENFPNKMVIKYVEEYINNVDEVLIGSKLFEEVQSKLLSTLDDDIKSAESAICQPNEFQNGSST